MLQKLDSDKTQGQHPRHTSRMLNLSERARRAARDAVECFRTAPAFEVLDADRRDKFQVIYPLAAHTIELVEAAEIIIAADIPYAAK
jgi:hypothetical protein